MKRELILGMAIFRSSSTDFSRRAVKRSIFDRINSVFEKDEKLR